MRYPLLLSALCLTLSPFAMADFPPNTAYVAEEEAAPLAVSKTAFARAIKRVQKAYEKELLLKLGCELKIVNSWADGTVNAYASRIGNVCKVEMLGGFGRYGTMTEDAIINVLCHEVGHHNGGLPRYSRDWASCEGQSDYWAQTCMKRVIGNSPARIQRAGVVLAENLARLSGDTKPSVLTPDQSRANGIYCSHPYAQCRLDTYVSGITSLPRPRCWYNP